jgi:hypothetical protein
VVQSQGVTLGALQGTGTPVMSLFNIGADRAPTDVQKFLPGL